MQIKTLISETPDYLRLGPPPLFLSPPWRAEIKARLAIIPREISKYSLSFVHNPTVVCRLRMVMAESGSGHGTT